MSDVTGYTLILVGKTGVGKSATGNTIVGATSFKVDDTSVSVTTECKVVRGDYENLNITVVDTPGVMDTAVNSDEAKEKTCNEMIEAISKCPDSGKRAICLVLKYGERFTEENKKSLYILTRVFGDEFLAKFCIIVFTHGDLFDTNYEEEKSFEEWCHQGAKGELAALLEECQHRCVLFRNKTKKDDIKKNQMEALIKLVDGLDEGYTEEIFTEAKKKHKRLLLESKLKAVLNEYYAQNRSLSQDIDTILMNKINEKKVRVLKDRAEEILNEIEKEDEGVFYDNEEVSLLEVPKLSTKDIITKCDDLIHLAKMQELKQKIISDINSLESKCINCRPSQCSLEAVKRLEEEINDVCEKYKKYGLDFSGDELIKCQPTVDSNVEDELFLDEKDLSFFIDVKNQFNILNKLHGRLETSVVFEINRNNIQKKIQSLRRELDAVPRSETNKDFLTQIKSEGENLLEKWEHDETMTEVLEPLRELLTRVDVKINNCDTNFKVEIISGVFAVAAGAVSAVGGVAGLSKNIIAAGVSRAAPGVATVLRATGEMVKAGVRRVTGKNKNTEEN